MVFFLIDAMPTVLLVTLRHEKLKWEFVTGTNALEFQNGPDPSAHFRFENFPPGEGICKKNHPPGGNMQKVSIYVNHPGIRRPRRPGRKALQTLPMPHNP